LDSKQECIPVSLSSKLRTSPPDISVFYMVRVIVRLDGEKDVLAFEEPELEQVVSG
jgi:hypothetical protein